MKRVCFIFNGGMADNISGGDIHILRLIEGMSKDCDVQVVAPEKANRILNELSKIKNIKILEIKEKGKFNLIKSYFYRARKTKQILRNKKFDLVVTSCPFFCDILPIKALKPKTKVITWFFHVLPPRKSNKVTDKLRNILATLQESICFRIIKKRSNLILTCNEIEKKKIIKKIGTKKIEIGKLGLNTAGVDKVKSGRERNCAVFVGRLVRQKGVYDFIKITKEIIKQKKEFKLYLIGEGPERANIEREICRENLSKNIILLGSMSNEKVLQKMKQSEFFFFPSYEEGFGIVIAEALYCGNKVICYELPHYKEFFKEWPSYVPLGDITGFVNKLHVKKDLVKQKEFMRTYEYKKRVKEEIELIWRSLKDGPLTR